MDETDREMMNLEFMLAQHRATPHDKPTPARLIDDDHIRTTIRLPRELVRQIDRYRKHHPDLPTRHQALRDLATLGLEAVRTVKWADRERKR